MTSSKATNSVGKAYEGSYQHVRDELRKLDLRVRVRVEEMRHALAHNRGVSTDPNLAISHGEVDRLLAQSGAADYRSSTRDDLLRRLESLQGEIKSRVRESVQRDVFLSLPAAGRVFALSPFESEALLICLAPEIDRKYDRLYAYLQDDIARQKPSVDLILDLLCRTDRERWNARACLTRDGHLFRAGILDVEEDPESPSGSSGLSRFLKVDERILGFVLGNDAVDWRLHGVAEIRTASSARSPEGKFGHRLRNLALANLSGGSVSTGKLVVYLRGGDGAGNLDLALDLCREMGRGLLHVKMGVLVAEASPERLLRLAFREALLRQCVVYLDDFDAVFGDDGSTHPISRKLASLAHEYGWLVFLSGEKPWRISPAFEDAVFQEIAIPTPEVPQRAAIWTRALEGVVEGELPAYVVPLARRFKLTSGQIDDAVGAARNAQAMNGDRPITLDDLYEACRRQSDSSLGELAVKTASRSGWDDLVLPEDQTAQLRDICIHVRQSHRVFSEWGFERKIGYGRGVSALFTGPPGTGKTMAAQVISGELRLALYRVDLSGVVSKYIGETEKNLSRIFKAAETSNAILFFDEADALFGKRTEVADAHDRYANIETSYLLQKMEEYEGVVILSTNLLENMDEAFTRRIRFIIEFPFPDAASRLRIWQTHFPNDAPVGKIDCKYLSEEFAIAGGSIRNVVLSAAFYAAEDGGSIDMSQILRGVRREYEKIGKVWSGTVGAGPGGR